MAQDLVPQARKGSRPSLASTISPYPEERMARQARIERDRAALGKRIARLRRERGISQRELAQLLDLGQAVLSNYERGARGINTDLLVEFARVLRVSADELLGVRPVPTIGFDVQRRFLKRLRYMDQLSEREQRSLLQTIDAFLARLQLKQSA
jgi:transcriptional regulator with XRE-family HTH domain